MKTQNNAKNTKRRNPPREKMKFQREKMKSRHTKRRHLKFLYCSLFVWSLFAWRFFVFCFFFCLFAWRYFVLLSCIFSPWKTKRRHAKRRKDAKRKYKEPPCERTKRRQAKWRHAKGRQIMSFKWCLFFDLMRWNFVFSRGFFLGEKTGRHKPAVILTSYLSVAVMKLPHPRAPLSYHWFPVPCFLFPLRMIVGHRVIYNGGRCSQRSIKMRALI